MLGLAIYSATIACLVKEERLPGMVWTQGDPALQGRLDHAQKRHGRLDPAQEHHGRLNRDQPPGGWVRQGQGQGPGWQQAPGLFTFYSSSKKKREKRQKNM